jgi:hypothetical protein
MSGNNPVEGEVESIEYSAGNPTTVMTICWHAISAHFAVLGMFRRPGPDMIITIA